MVVDRISLSSAGLGPKSQCVPTISKAEPGNVVKATLKQYGLTLVPFPNIFVITTVAELSRLESRDRWGERFAEALVWGSDRTDRFQSLARWRGEPSPKLVSAIGEEAALGIKLPPGWSAWRFEGRRWPKKDAFVYLIETRTRIDHGMDYRRSCVSWRGLGLADGSKAGGSSSWPRSWHSVSSAGGCSPPVTRAISPLYTSRLSAFS